MSPRDLFDTCRYKRGFLFLRDCAEPAVGACSICGRPICLAHQAPSTDGSMACLECAATDQREDPLSVNEETDNIESRRTGIYSELAYEPSYDGHHRYYSDADFRTFDDQQIVDHEKPANLDHHGES